MKPAVTNRQPTPKIYLSTTLERFNKTKKEITIKDLQREVNKIKDEIKYSKIRKYRNPYTSQ